MPHPGVIIWLIPFLNDHREARRQQAAQMVQIKTIIHIRRQPGLRPHKCLHLPRIDVTIQVIRFEPLARRHLVYRQPIEVEYHAQIGGSAVVKILRHNP